MTMMCAELTTAMAWRMSATPLPPNREMGPADWQLLDDALVYMGVPEGTKTEEAGAIRHWRWSEPLLPAGNDAAFLWCVWCLEDRAECVTGTRREMEAALPEWASGRAADVDPEHFHYEIRRLRKHTGIGESDAKNEDPDHE